MSRQPSWALAALHPEGTGSIGVVWDTGQRGLSLGNRTRA